MKTVSKEEWMVFRVDASAFVFISLSLSLFRGVPWVPCASDSPFSLSLSLSLLLLSSQLNAGVVVAVGPGRPSPMDGKIIPNGTSSSNIHAHQTNHVSSLTLLLLRRRQNRRQSLTPGVWRSSRASRRRSAKERVPLIQRRGDSRDITGRIRKAHAPHSNTTIAVLTMISVDPTRTFSFLPRVVSFLLSFQSKGCSPLLSQTSHFFSSFFESSFFCIFRLFLTKIRAYNRNGAFFSRRDAARRRWPTGEEAKGEGVFVSVDAGAAREEAGSGG